MSKINNRLQNIDYSAPIKRATVFINESILKESKAQAAREGYTFSAIVEMSLEYYLENLAYSEEEIKEWGKKDKKLFNMLNKYKKIKNRFA